jgi:sugar transferase (PEP-CTERM/EpsH1 system associated)
MKILWVKAGGLVPPDTGGKIRSYNILRELARHHSVTFFSFYGAHKNDLHPELKNSFDRVVCIPLDLPAPRGLRELCDYSARIFVREPYGITKYCQPQVRHELRRLIQQEHHDVILCDFLAAAGAIPWDYPCSKVLFTHNVEAVIWRRHYEVARNPLWKALAWREWRATKAAEEKYLCLADHVLTVSENDRDFFATFLDPKRLTVIPTGADTEYFRPFAQQEAPDSLVFTGSMDWLPNDDAILYFVKEVLPLVAQQIPQVSLCVVGRKPSRRLRELANSEKNIQLTGWVEDVRPYLARAAVCIVPLRIGGGTRLKIFEAMSMAKPVVSTTIGAEGLPVRHGENILLADEPNKFAASVVSLLRDPAQRKRLGQASRKLVEENYSWVCVAKGFAEVLNNIAADRNVKAVVHAGA